ncbi:MAG TPA: multicopper oxidase domain-containing protein [Candidatus Nitrosocosmicus sp.]
MSKDILIRLWLSNHLGILFISLILCISLATYGTFISIVNPGYSTNINTISNKNNISNITNSTLSVQQYDKLKNCATDQHTPTNGITYLTHFSCGHVTILKNGTTLRQFTIIAKEGITVPISNTGLTLNAWTYNGSIPGPTMRMTEGDHIQLLFINSKDSKHDHSIHMHSIHAGDMDGMMGPGGDVAPGKSFTYIFTALPFGVYPYHCHVEPTDEHINQGLYGMMIIDPKTPRPQMTEMVMLMNGYDLNYTKEGVDRLPTVKELKTGLPEVNHNNAVYTVNGVAFEYKDRPINLITGKSYRIYLVNMLEFDPLNNFHLHGNLFNYYSSGTSLKPDYTSDIVPLMQGDRGIVEFTYKYPGMYMFHSHKNEFSMKGWVGFFDVTEPTGQPMKNSINLMPTIISQPMLNQKSQTEISAIAGLAGA